MRRAALLVVSAVLLLAWAVPAAAVSDTYGGVSFHPFTMPSGQGCVRWIDAAEGTTWNCDPVNVVFPGQTWQQVRDRLRAKGWTTAGFGSSQYLHFSTLSRLVQNVQLFRGSWTNRYHVRLWQPPGSTVTLGNVHHERDLFHTIDMAWDGAEAFVAGQLCGASCTTEFLESQWAMQDGVDGVADGDTLWRGWGNDANASVIP